MNALQRLPAFIVIAATAMLASGCAAGYLRWFSVGAVRWGPR